MLHQSVKKIKRAAQYTATSLLATLCIPQVAMAGGLVTVSTDEQVILATLQSAAPVTITLAIMLAGYLFLFTEVQHKVIFRILAGGFLIGGAPLIAAMFH